MITIEVNVVDLDVLVLTNIGAYTEDISKDGKTVTLGTSSQVVADSWIEQLRAAGRSESVKR